jgi:DnaJ like chaperone protein
MYWYGKAIGALAGLLLTHSLVGALIGAFLGHLFDAQAGNPGVQQGDASPPPSSSLDVQEAFFRTTFQVMGHVAKADGRVSEEEIRAARAIMSEFRLGEREVRFAIELFTQGKASTFPLEATVQQLYRATADRPDLHRMFVQIQLQAALWAGNLEPLARKILGRVCAALDISAYELVQMEAILRMQQSSRQSANASSSIDRVAEAYSVLGVPSSASNAEVTKAYRRLMNQNHPDKLVARGLPESMIKVAEEKTRQILAAYEVLREVRNMR